MPLSKLEGPIAVASDHAGVAVRQRLMKWVTEHGGAVRDFGPPDETSVDYPDFAAPVAEAVARGDVPYGLLLCGTGLGMSYAANRHPGIRAALCWSVETAKLAKEHNDANILVLPARAATLDPLEDILAAFLATRFSDDPRHLRRIKKIDAGCDK